MAIISVFLAGALVASQRGTVTSAGCARRIGLLNGARGGPLNRRKPGDGGPRQGISNNVGPAVLHFIPLFVGLGLVPVGYWLARYLVRSARFRRRFTAVDSVPIASVKRGQLVKVTGRVRALEPLLEAPLTGRKCVYYWVLVEEHRDYWAPFTNEHRFSEFVVEDDSGTARVVPDRAQALLVLDAHFSSSMMEDATYELEEYLASFGKKSTVWGLFFDTNRKLRYREGVLEPGERVTVMGQATMELDPAPGKSRGGYRKRNQRPVIGPPKGGPLLVSDDPTAVDPEGEHRKVDAEGTWRPIQCPHCRSWRGVKGTYRDKTCLSCGKAFEAF